MSVEYNEERRVSRRDFLTVSGLGAAALALSPTEVLAQPSGNGNGYNGTGSVVFFHPDGTGPNHWQALRTYWYGPDATSNWDLLPQKALYRGHMADSLVGTSNGGATTHAFGYKVEAESSFGQDGQRSINSLSGFGGSIMRQAQYNGHPVGVVNDGIVTEPGTGCFLAEAPSRDDNELIALQMLNGRSANGPAEVSADPDPQVIVGGGERYFLPKQDVSGGQRANGYHGPGSRADGRNLIQEARTKGYEVIRNRAEFEALMGRLRTNPAYEPKVLGLFTRNDTYNDVPEEALMEAGLIRPDRAEDDKRSNLLLYGTYPGLANPNNTTDDEDLPDKLVGVNGRLVTENGLNPPTIAEMTQMALCILSRAEARTGVPFMLVSEPESCDNFGNENNSVGQLFATYRADQAIAEIAAYQQTSPNTLLLTAADSDAGGIQIYALMRKDDGSLPSVSDEDASEYPVSYNPTGKDSEEIIVPLDGLYGRDSVAFESEPDQFGKRHPFGINVVSTADVQGGILSRAVGGNAYRLHTPEFSARFDNIDVYRMMYENLFGVLLNYPQGKRAPTRGAVGTFALPETGGPERVALR